MVRIRLREGQAKRLRPEEVPALDRPVRFAVQRGRHPPVLADTIPELLALLRKAPRYEREERGEPRMAGKRGRRRGSGRRGRPPRARDGRPGRRR